MDITTVTSFRAARTRADLLMQPGEVPMAGGTWLLSEPQPRTTGFVDLTTMGWPEVEVDDRGLTIGATCTIARLLDWSLGRSADLPPVPAEWRAAALVEPAANALLASFKIWTTATVGGNLCQSFAAGAMISLVVALDGVAVVWTPDGGERRMPVAELPAGNGVNTLAPGEILRAIEIPASALRAEARLQKIALAELGRSGAVVTGRVDEDGTATFGVTAAIDTPRVLRFAALPSAVELRDAVTALDGYYSDPLGAADWRRGVSAVLAERIRSQLTPTTAERADATGPTGRADAGQPSGPADATAPTRRTDASPDAEDRP